MVITHLQLVLSTAYNDKGDIEARVSTGRTCGECWIAALKSATAPSQSSTSSLASPLCMASINCQKWTAVPSPTSKRAAQRLYYLLPKDSNRSSISCDKHFENLVKFCSLSTLEEEVVGRSMICKYFQKQVCKLHIYTSVLTCSSNVRSLQLPKNKKAPFLDPTQKKNLLSTCLRASTDSLSTSKTKEQRVTASLPRPSLTKAWHRPRLSLTLWSVWSGANSRAAVKASTAVRSLLFSSASWACTYKVFTYRSQILMNKYLKICKSDESWILTHNSILNQDLLTV